MQIGYMGFARVERHDHALALEIDFYVLHPRNLLQYPSQFPYALIAILAFSGNFNRFQNRIVAALRKKWIGPIGINRSCGVHGVFFI